MQEIALVPVPIKLSKTVVSSKEYNSTKNLQIP
jgi:hypothetical protein